MTRPYDAALKDLIENHPADWLAFIGGHSSGDVRVIDADLSTVTAAADKVIRVEGLEPWLLHVELQSSPGSDLAGRLQWYNTLLRYRHELPVRTAVVLLRRSADSPQWTGVYHNRLPGEGPYLEFRYQVIRLWQLPATAVLNGGVGIVPLAPLTDVPVEGLPGVVQQVAQRLRDEATPADQAELWKTTFVLTGLRLRPEAMLHLFKGVSIMGSILEDSSAFQIWKEATQRNTLREILLRQGQKRFGPPTSDTVGALKAIQELARLERLSDRILDVASWEELLASS